MHARTHRAGVAAAALLAGAVTAGAADMTSGSPLRRRIRCWPPGRVRTRACRRSTRQVRSTSGPRSRRRWPRTWPRSSGSPTTPRPRPSRTRSPRWSAPAARSIASSTLYGIWGSTMNDAGVPGGRARDGAEARRVQRRDHPEREALQAHRGGLRLAARRRSSRPSSSGSTWLYYTNFVRAGAQARRGREEAPVGDQPAARRRSTRTSARTCSPTRSDHAARARRARPTSPACRSRCAPARPRPPESRGQKGKWVITEHALVASSRS